MELKKQVKGFFLPLPHKEHFHGGLGLQKKRKRRKKKPIMLLYRYPNNRFPSCVSNSTKHLKRYSCCCRGCWSSWGQSWSSIKQPQEMQLVCFPPQSTVSAENYAGPACRCSVWSFLGAGQVRWEHPCWATADPMCPLYPPVLSLLLPLCVCFNGDKCEAHGVQSHCGLKRISDDRKYVNLLFPSGQRKKVQRFNGWRR